MSAPPVRVAICADSRAYAEGLRRFLETDERLGVETIATSAEELLGGLATDRPDLITMDLELPGIDGVEAIRRIMETRPTPIVVISTRTLASSDGLVAAALAAGATEIVQKDAVRLDRRLTPQAVALRRRLARLVPGDAVPATSAPSPSAPSPADRVSDGPGGLPDPSVATVVGVAASAGGPSALAEVLGLLPADFDLPVLVVQHISDGYAEGLASWLDGVIPLPVRLARDGEPAGRGVAIAPDGAHLLLAADGRLRLDRQTVRGFHRPSADLLLESLARVRGPGAVAVVLTGIGRDGAAGVAAVRAAGGVALAEHFDDAALPGMPAAARGAGATSLERVEIGSTLAALSGSAVR
jgi:two-component system, chemotaxis family, protein-glutamate methylesterase/glutaminase